MNKQTYSQNIANAITEDLTNNDWSFSFNDEKGVFEFGITIGGKIRKVNYLIRISDNEYIVYLTSPIGADKNNERMMAAMAEFVCRANYGLKYGNFEFDMRDGEIRFKSFVDCSAITPTQEMVRNSIHYPAGIFDNYCDGILGIIFGDMSAKEAVDQCEGSKEDRLRSALESLCDEDDDGELSDMLSRLAARLDIAEEELEHISEYEDDILDDEDDFLDDDILEDDDIFEDDEDSSADEGGVA